MSTTIVIIACVIIIIVPTLITARILSKPKKELLCLAFESEKAFRDVLSMLNESNVQSSLRLSSPTQQGYNDLGASHRAPKEIWVHLSECEKVLAIIGEKYETEKTPTALLIKPKSNFSP